MRVKIPAIMKKATHLQIYKNDNTFPLKQDTLNNGPLKNSDTDREFYHYQEPITPL